MRGEAQSKSDRLAVLIDADNANSNLIEPLLKEVAKYGTAHVKRIYGDWTGSQLSRWKDRLNKFAIQPIQQFGYTTGKNATDSALIIDAMDLLYTKNFDGFCIVSSDSDFTRLASRIRESGLIVYGFGERKTPEAFVSACDRFIYTEILEQLESTNETHLIKDSVISDKADPKIYSGNKSANKDNQKVKNNRNLLSLLKDAYEALTDDEDEWIHLGPFGTQLTKLSSSFDPRNYGCKKLSDLVREVGIFETRKTDKTVQIKLKSSS